MGRCDQLKVCLELYKLSKSGVIWLGTRQQPCKISQAEKDTSPEGHFDGVGDCS